MTRHRVASLAATLALGLLLASCSVEPVPPEPPPASETTANAPTVTASPTASATDTARPTTGGTQTGTAVPGAQATAGPIPVDPTWQRDPDLRRGYGVAGGDVLDVRAAPGPDEPLITVIASQATSIQTYGAIVRIGQEFWQPVQVPGGAGWVNARYLRPMGPPTPGVAGRATAALTTAADQVSNAIEAGDGAALAAAADPALGVLFSTDAYISDDDPVLSVQQLAAGDSTQMVWGYTDGEGLPIRQTIAERLASIAGSTALTSTAAIGYDVRVKTGNTIDNLAERFPGAHVVEYHFPGTKAAANMDWSSVRLVFDTTNGPRLVAVVQDSWTI